MTSLRKARAGVAGLEFALLSPVLLTLFLGIIDTSGALLTARRMGIAANSVASIATTSSVQNVALNQLSGAQAWQATTAAFAFFPGWTAPLAQKSFTITLSGVTFTAAPTGCAANCAYTAQVVWSVANNLGTPKLRACGALGIVPNSSPASFLTLPRGNLGPTSLLVADISYTFQPMFFGFLFGNIAMMQSAYISPRINNQTILTDTGGGVVGVKCAT